MLCPRVQRDNPRALASGLSTVQADELLFFTCSMTPSADLGHYGESKDLSILGLCLKVGLKSKTHRYF